ncbi:basic helix-loop-helix (bHLH) DNA-bindingsuperfamily protein [Striga asiatica]|uniref:Basic helix-loop-helix (BHLH) DNA-bindingsuperfamily protein n=1 Tax=Striga asiatica TaxID=4170 RepID=A0A5A7Q0I0_STRAF|nr:basic helix-loop-helix (bHLH) DNA-bindingsuperfamily protein [Striga asiatica]
MNLVFFFQLFISHMETEENFEEMLDDLKAILPEIYSTSCRPQDHQNHASNIVNSWEYFSDTTHHTADPLTSSSSSLATATPKIISFESTNILSTEDCDDNYEDGTLSQKRAASRTVWQARDHRLAEKKRRQNLGQLFINLSKVVPGLRKLDKASLLEDAIDYLKALQDRVSALEEGITSKRSSTGEYDYISSNSGNCKQSTISESGPAEIKARILGKHVLIKVHCKKQNGLMSRVPSQMEKLYLNMMQSEFRGTVKDIVDHSHTIFFKQPQDQDNNRPD